MIKDKIELIGLDPDVQECITSSDRFDVVCLDQGFSTFFHRRTPGVYMIHYT